MGIPTQRDYGDVGGQNLDKNDARGITWSSNNPFTAYPCRMTVTLTSDPVLMRSENDMSGYVCSTGALQIAVDVDSWQHYIGGVMTANQCGTNLDHDVVWLG